MIRLRQLLAFLPPSGQMRFYFGHVVMSPNRNHSIVYRLSQTMNLEYAAKLAAKLV